MTTHKRCACGRPVTAGWTLPSAAARHRRCLICRTADLLGASPVRYAADWDRDAQDARDALERYAADIENPPQAAAL